MSNPQLHVCKYCKKDDFQSKRGLQMHLDKSKTCNSLFREAADKLDKAYGKVVDARADTMELAYEEYDDNYDEPVTAHGLGPDAQHG